MKMTKRIPALILAVFFCFMLITPALAVDSQVSEDDPKIVEIREKIEELKKEVAEAKGKRQGLENQISSTKATASEIQAQVYALQNEINAYQSEINALGTEIEYVQEQLDYTEEAMEDQKLQIEATQELLGQRVRAMYMAGNVSSIELVFEAESFENLLNRLELVKRITQHDNKIISDLRDDIVMLEELQAKLEKDKVDLQTSKDELVSAQAELKANKKEVDAKLLVLEATISKLNKEDKELKEIEAQAEEQQAAYAQAIYNMINGVASTGDGSANLICPVPYSSAYISSGYGYRTLGSTSPFHYGVDITMPGAMEMNKKIISAGIGTVLISSNNCTHNYKKTHSCGCNGGYGNYCVIDHGNGVIAFYAHLTKSNVVVGQIVNQGDTIGIMGCTGYSTGAHLHFEIRTNMSGARSSTNVNPLNYISVP